MKSDFINNITHEFNTPLNTIKVAGANLKNEHTKNSAAKVEELADIIIRQNARLQKLIEDIMNASVFEEEKLSLNFSDVDICELVSTASADIKIKYEEKEITFNIKSPDKLLCRCDEFQIMTAVYNLVDNAAKYSPEKSQIEIEIRQDERAAVLSITDHGIGLSEEDRKHVFDKFFRVREGKYASVKGLGLGLYFVKKIIDAHSGKIEAASSPGKGSTFIIYLPASK
jgi:two-component system phosphate regulon sensor histidine kinase PhoR